MPNFSFDNTMKYYPIIPLLLIVGCGNPRQQQAKNIDETLSFSIEQTDSIKAIPPAIVVRIREDITDILWINDEPVNNHKIDLWQAVNGDFNGDGKIDTAYLYGAQQLTNQELELYEQEWFNGIIFSDISIPSFRPTRGPQFNYLLLTNEEDIDGDGADEIGFLTRAFTRFGMYHVYSLRGGEWEEIVNVYTYDKDNEKDGNDPDLIKIDPDKKNYVIIRAIEWDDEICWYKEIEKEVRIK